MRPLNLLKRIQLYFEVIKHGNMFKLNDKIEWGVIFEYLWNKKLRINYE